MVVRHGIIWQNLRTTDRHKSQYENFGVVVQRFHISTAGKTEYLRDFKFCNY